MEVDELLWVKLQAGAPVIDARFKCRAAEGRIRHLRILVDPRLQLLPTTGGTSSIAAIHATPGDPVTLDLDLSDDVAQPNREAIVDLAFLVTGTSGIGNFRLPRLESTGVRSSRRLLAVTLDPAMHYEEQLGDDIKPQSSADFLAAWGTAAREPQLVYAIPQGTAAWLLATRPTEVRNAVEQLTSCSFGQGVASVHCSARRSRLRRVTISSYGLWGLQDWRSKMFRSSKGAYNVSLAGLPTSPAPLPSFSPGRSVDANSSRSKGGCGRPIVGEVTTPRLPVA